MSPSSDSAASAPTQTQFISHGLVSTQVPDATTCSICVEPCLQDEEVVKLVPCTNCFFHRNCILTWFTSSHSQRGSCPNDRTVLFIPDPLPTSTPASSNGPTIPTELPNSAAAHQHALARQRALGAHIVRIFFDDHVQEIEAFARAQSDVVDRDTLITMWADTDHIRHVRTHEERITYMRSHFYGCPTNESARVTLSIDGAEDLLESCIARYREAVQEVVGERRMAFRLRLAASRLFAADIDAQMVRVLDAWVTRPWWILPHCVRQVESMGRVVERVARV